jgi:hypothetical protein
MLHRNLRNALTLAGCSAWLTTTIVACSGAPGITHIELEPASGSPRVELAGEGGPSVVLELLPGSAIVSATEAHLRVGVGERNFDVRHTQRAEGHEVTVDEDGQRLASAEYGPEPQRSSVRQLLSSEGVAVSPDSLALVDPVGLLLVSPDAWLGLEAQLAAIGARGESSVAHDPALGALEQAQRAAGHATGGTGVIDIDPDLDCVGHYECTTFCLPYFGCYVYCRWVCEIV